MFIQTDQFLSLTEEQKWDKDYTLKWCRLVKKWKLKRCKKCWVMGKTTDLYCVRHQKIVNKGFRIACELSNFILFGIKRTGKLKKSLKLHQISKNPIVFFFTSRKMRSVVPGLAVYIISGV